MKPYPLSFDPILAEQPWGALGPSPFFDASVSGEFLLGEIRLLSEANRAAAGPRAGVSLERLRHLWGAGLMGPLLAQHPERPFPLEIKLLRTGSAQGPVFRAAVDVFWLILSAEEESLIGAGLPPGLTFPLAQREVGHLAHLWPELLGGVPAESGQSLFLPRGTTVSLGPDITVIQVGRPGPEPLLLYSPGRKSLPLEDGSTKGGDISVEPDGEPQWLNPEIVNPKELRWRAGNYAVDQLTVSHLNEFITDGPPRILCPLFGQGRLRSNGPSPAVRLTPGRAYLLPSRLGSYSLESGSALTFLRIADYGA